MGNCLSSPSNTEQQTCIYCKTNETFPSSLWCSKRCRDQTPDWQRLTNEKGGQSCIYCKRKNATEGNDFCSNLCERTIRRKAPHLLKLSSGSPNYKNVTKQFTGAWKHPHKTVPEVADVWKIFCSEDLNNRYSQYRDEIERKHKFTGKIFPKGDRRRKMSAGNEQRRFHGTKTSCHIGLTKGNVCKDSACSVCCIIKGGYKLSCAGTNKINPAFQRFGKGLYFSGTSSKSDDYNEGSLKNFQGSAYKVMILNKVVVGQGYQLIKNDVKLTKPPPGFDSVLGEPSNTGSLNYDEIVVYKEESSIPQYLIVYKVN